MRKDLEARLHLARKKIRRALEDIYLCALEFRAIRRMEKKGERKCLK